MKSIIMNQEVPYKKNYSKKGEGILKLKTKEFNKVLDKVSKGLGAGKFLEITAYIHIQLKENMLIMAATDTAIYVTTKTKVDYTGEEKEVIVEGQKLVNLIKKTTTEEVELIFKDSYVLLKGNGEYKLEISTDDFPKYQFEIIGEKEIDFEELKKAVDITSSAVAKDMTVPYLAGYYISDNVVATDSIKMTLYKENFLKETSLLLPQELIAVLVSNVIEEKKVLLKYNDTAVFFEAGGVIIYSSQLGGVENYPEVEGMVDVEFEQSAKINRKKFVSILERTEIFTEELDDFGIVLEYGENKVIIKSLDEKSVEELPAVVQGIKLSQKFNVKHLIEMLNSLSETEITIEYSEEINFIKISSGKITQLIATLQEEEEE